jgi:hypothetical protein
VFIHTKIGFQYHHVVIKSAVVEIVLVVVTTSQEVHHYQNNKFIIIDLPMFLSKISPLENHFHYFLQLLPHRAINCVAIPTFDLLHCLQVTNQHEL